MGVTVPGSLAVMNIDLADVTWVGVGLAFVFSMVFGFLWYSRFAFGTIWMRMIGKSEAELKAGAGPAMAFAAIGALLTAAAIGVLALLAGAQNAVDGSLVGFVAGVGFGLPVTIAQVVFPGLNRRLIWVNGLHHVLEFTGMGAIVGMFA